MNWLDRIRSAITWRPEPRVYVSQRQAGVTVTEDTAQTFSAVAACGRIISETLASLPWPVYRKASVGREALPAHPVNWLLNYQPNPEQTAYVFRRQMLMHYLFWGNGYAEIERGFDGRAMALWPLLPDRTCIERSETGALVCRVNTGSEQYIIPRENVFHIADGSYDGIMGASRIQLARRTIGAAIAQDVFTSSYYQNGASVGGVIEQKEGKTLTPQAVETLLASFNDKYAGPDRARKTLYLDGGMEYRPIPMADVELLASRRFSIEEVCRWFGVPQHFVQMLAESNYAISYTADKNFVEHTLRPIAVLSEQEANIRLFGARAQGTVYSRINLAGLMRAEPKTRAEYYRSLVNAGVMSINEVRELEEMNSIGADGDEHYLQTNMTTVARIASGEIPTAQPAPSDTPAEPAPTNVIRREALAWWKENRA